MTEEKIKEMLNGIINNGEKWEYRWNTADGWSNWKDYKLGYEIYDNYEYRKVKTWYVYDNGRCYSIVDYKISVCKYPFEGSKDECEKWIEEHTKKTWLEEYLENYFTKHSEFNLARRGDLLSGIRIGATEVCKKILEEVKCKIAEKQKLGFTFSNIDSEELKEIIKELGIEV